MKPAFVMVTGTTPETAGSQVIRTHVVPVITSELIRPAVSS